MQEKKATGTVRVIEILLGLTAVIIGVVVLFYPGMTIVTLTILLAIALLFVGLFRFFWGFTTKGVSRSARTTSTLIGLTIVVVAILIMAFPVIAAGTAVVLIDIALLIYAIGRIALGVTARSETTGVRGLQIASGLLLLIIGSTILLFPTLGITALGVLLGIGFLLIGIESIAAGIIARRNELDMLELQP